MNHLLQTLEQAPWENSAFYKEWLAQSYYYTQHSTRMLAYCAGWTNPVHGEYYRRSLKHIREEQGHEQIAINDLQAMSGDIKDFPEMGVTRSLWEPQFYKINRDPFSLLGYILSLEALAVFSFKEIYARTSKAHGEESGRFIKTHADDDPHHVTEALKQIEKCPSESRPMIHENFTQTNTMYALMLNEIVHL